MLVCGRDARHHLHALPRREFSLRGMNGRAVHLNAALGQHAPKGAGRTVRVDAPEGVEEDLAVLRIRARHAWTSWHWG